MMLPLQSCDDLGLEHPFICARTLGVYHANIIHKVTTMGFCNYTPKRMEFLFIHWFSYQGSANVQWANLKLDPLKFMSIHSEDTFSFVDPADILRASHLTLVLRRESPHRSVKHI